MNMTEIIFNHFKRLAIIAETVPDISHQSPMHQAMVCLL